MTDPYRIELLARSHDRTAFSSGEQQIDDWFRKQASQASRKGIATVHVMIDNVTDAATGFYTLSNFTVLSTDLPAGMSRALSDRIPLPAHLIGQLAVDTREQDKGYGSILLLDALRRAYRTTVDSASVAVVVHAISAQIAMWYTRYNFIPFPTHPLSLCLPMKDSAGLFPTSTSDNIAT